MNKNGNDNNKIADLGEEENLDFQSRHIVQFKCPVFSHNKNRKTYKET